MCIRDRDANSVPGGGQPMAHPKACQTPCQREPQRRFSGGGTCFTASTSPGRKHANNGTSGRRNTSVRPAPATKPPTCAHQAVSPPAALNTFHSCISAQKPSTQADPIENGTKPNSST